MKQMKQTIWLSLEELEEWLPQGTWDNIVEVARKKLRQKINKFSYSCKNGYVDGIESMKIHPIKHKFKIIYWAEEDD